MSYFDDITNIWYAARELVEARLGKGVTNLWIEPLKVHSYEKSIFTLSVETEFNLQVINERYLGLISECLSEVLGFDVEARVIFVGEKADVEKLKRQIKLTPPDESESRESDAEENAGTVSGGENLLPQNYNFEYTFDNFIVGSSNKFAHAACTAVADRPAMDYNPLFIYGPSGLGKTHLMSAVVNAIRKKNPATRVIYIKGDEFTNEMIDSLARQDMPKFHEKYRSCDILLIDDIQFIAGKNSTQEEFFHTFNTLYEAHKQIILSSDRPPKDIQTLEERLKTRFEWGLIADIQPPDLELRIAIIKKKAEQINIELPDDVLTFLAENLRSNIRQIEGAIKKLSAKCFLSGQKITMEMAKSCIAELLGGAEPVNVTVDKIFTSVYKKYGIPKEDLLSTKRNKDIAQARHIAIYLIREITEMSFPNIGKLFKRDHTTALASYELIAKKVAAEPMFNLEIEGLIKDLSV